MRRNEDEEGIKSWLHKERNCLVKDKNKIALFIAILFHACGAIGILFTPYRQWFINSTPFTLLLMAGLLIFTQQQKNFAFILFFIVAFASGLVVEIIGVHTGILFGNYVYGDVMGAKIFDVPVIIGINWFIVIYSCGCLLSLVNTWIFKKLGTEIQLSEKLKKISFVIDVSMLATFFDWWIEPVAVKLGFWQWLGDGKIPFFNYLCWFLISMLLATFFHSLKFDKRNQFAVHLLIIQLLFFLTLSF